MTPQEYKQTHSYKEAIQLAIKIHELSEELPSVEQGALVQDLHKSAVEVPACIALNLINSQAADLGPLVRLQTQVEMVGQIYPAIEVSEAIEQIESLIERVGTYEGLTEGPKGAKRRQIEAPGAAGADRGISEPARVTIETD